MTSGRIEGLLAGIAVLSVLTIFLFPAVQGPYSVVHGPVTALLSVRAAAGLRTAIVRAGLNAVRSCLSFARLAPFSFSSHWTAPFSAEFSADSLACRIQSHLALLILFCRSQNLSTVSQLRRAFARAGVSPMAATFEQVFPPFQA